VIDKGFLKPISTFVPIICHANPQVPELGKSALRDSEDYCEAQANGKITVLDVQGRALAMWALKLPAPAEAADTESYSKQTEGNAFRAEPAFHLCGLEKLSECFYRAYGNNRITG